MLLDLNHHLNVGTPPEDWHHKLDKSIAYLKGRCEYSLLIVPMKWCCHNGAVMYLWLELGKNHVERKVSPQQPPTLHMLQPLMD
jgi:hypothetical protein